MGGGEVSSFGKYLFELHGSSDFHVDLAVVGYEIGEVILVDDLLWDVREFHAHVFISVEWSIEIHVTDVHGHALGTWSGNDTVDVDLERSEACSFGAVITRVVENEIAVTGDTGLVCLFFLRLDGADDSGISDGATRWYL